MPTTPDSPTTLLYVHDPMCSWCWAFRPVWQQLQQSLPDSVAVQYLVGGLAPDSHVPMPTDMQAGIAGIWRQIEKQVPGTEFNHEFWRLCQPRRSTYPACRAVLAAQALGQHDAMLEAIQRGYYLEAKNPSDTETLIELARGCGMNADEFAHFLKSDEVEQQLQQHLALVRQIGVQGFPSLVLIHQQHAVAIAIDYNNTQSMLETIEAAIEGA